MTGAGPRPVPTHTANATLNQRLAALGDGPFRRLDLLLAGVAPAPNRKVLDFALGEPRHPFPASVARLIQDRQADWGRYPPMKGTAEFLSAVASWLERRYRLIPGTVNPTTNVAPIAGSREGLFLIAQVVVPAQSEHRPAVLLPNPYYVAYAGAAVGSGGEPVFVPATAESGHLPDYFSLPREVLERTALCYLCSPANPQGVFADASYLRRLIALTREYGFILAVDECYAEIYDRHAPIGALEVCAQESGGFDNVLVFHSLSKRSSVPGLRSGFVAGDPRVIAEFLRFRAYSAPTVPLPVLAASAALWDDDQHVVETRDSYRAKFDQAERALGNRFGFRRPDGTFFLWLNVRNGEAAARQLWADAALRVMPGAYLGYGDGPDNPGAPYVRVALVDDLATTADAVARIAATLSNGI